jgi:hypothetical protein
MIKSALFKTPGHEQQRTTVMLLDLADSRKPTPFILKKKKESQSKTFYWNYNYVH